MPSNLHKTELSTIKLDLSHHPDKFISSSQEITITKKVNFIFGKNGTGKTTISDEILSQQSADYDVCIFKDFDGVVENDRLNAVALGTANAKIQKEIDVIDGEIAEIEKQINQPDDQTVENLFLKAKKTGEEYSKQEKKLISFFTDSARKIKNISNPQIAKTSYDKTNFKDDISKANLLLEDNIAAHKITIKSDKKADVSVIQFPDIDLSSCLESTNEILQSSVTKKQDIPELTGKTDKQHFARQGMRIHEHEPGEICAFCGNKITSERWELLCNYFNEEVKKVEKSIASEIDRISSEIDAINEIKEMKKDKFYDKFDQDIKNLNLKIAAKRMEYIKFFEELQKGLAEKKSKLFVKSKQLEIDIPANFEDIEKEYKDMAERHNKLSLNLNMEQDKARDALRYHEVKKILTEFKYDEENIKLAKLKTANDDAQNNLRDKRLELQYKQDARKTLISQTKDEEKIVTKINKLLSSMGAVSFSLKLIVNDDEKQRGQYQIEGHDGNVRPIIKLSKGEKNIIAFLYFVFSLESVDNDSKPKIIVLDDPMTSNDDTMQYLMIDEIQKLYRRLKDGNYFILLTHNCHFYLNVRPNTVKTYKENDKEISFYEKYGVYHFLSDGKRTAITVVGNGKQDFKTSYETLWKELVFLHDAEEASSDLMLSPCRKICETYMKFTKKGIEPFYGDNMNAKKLFDVNQHSIDDYEAEANGKTKAEIKSILSNLFKANGAEEHFDSYWRSGEK